MAMNDKMVVRSELLEIITNLIIMKSNLEDEEECNIYIQIIVNLYRSPKPKCSYKSS